MLILPKELLILLKVSAILNSESLEESPIDIFSKFAILALSAFILPSKDFDISLIFFLMISYSLVILAPSCLSNKSDS